MVPHADLKTLDPLFNTAYITRNHGYMVFDTLFSQDSKGQVKPQMVDTWTSSEDGKTWTFTLRPGLKFNDGTPVTAEDCIASLQRWAKKDTLGQAMMAAGAELAATGDNTFTLTLKEPFGLVLDALSKPSGMPPFIMPKRLAMTDPNTQVTEMGGSGPFLFKRDEWVPGNKVVYVKNPAYVPRAEPADGLAGGKNVKVDRVEWLYIPDGNTATAALMNGEQSGHHPEHVGCLARHGHRQRAASAVQQSAGPPGALPPGKPEGNAVGHGLPGEIPRRLLRHPVHLRLAAGNRRRRRALRPA
ncbi:hypothetical protein G6F57_017814 [Rhizopus arrhizus]|nr:hypothetical protein G6F57_017814 [Rhizopus arrhizus]